MIKEKLLTSGELAAELGVHPGTVSRWWRNGLIEPASITAGGHARWRLSEVQAQLRKARKRDE